MPTATHDAALIRKIGLIITWGLGVLPLAVLLVWGVELINAYLSLISLIIGVTYIRHAKRLANHRKDVHDQ